MNIYFENLYRIIFEKESIKYSKLRVISGYASSSFLQRIMQEFPTLSVDLYIGMSAYGVHKRDHLEFQRLVKENERVNVYYQVWGTPNHMKILEFMSEMEKKVFIGSANFSENGFFNHKEVMIEVKEKMGLQFSKQQKNSILCVKNGIEDLIPIYDDEMFKQESLESTRKENKLKLIQAEGNVPYTTKSKVTNIKKIKLLQSKIDPEYYNSFEVTIVLPKTNASWNRKGINAWVEGKNPVLEQTPRLFFNKVFPSNQEFTIYTDDNKVLRAKLTGQFESQLQVLNLDLFEYICNRIDLRVRRPISFDDLKSRGCTKLYFTRINENEYEMSINKKT